MAEVIDFPTPEAPDPKPPRHSGKQLWLMKAQLRAVHGEGHESVLLDAKIHAVCGHLLRYARMVTGDDRRPDRCSKCPRYGRHEDDVELTRRGCYMLAEEMVVLAICGDQYEPE